MKNMITILTILLYFLATLLIGWYSKGKLKNKKSYNGMGLSLGLCVFAGAGEWMGGTSTTGVSEYGYLYGISGAWYTIANGIGVCVLAVFFAKLYRSLETPTVSGIVGKYIGKSARKVSSAMLIIVTMVVGISQLVALGSMGESLFGLPYAASILLFGVLILVYTALGGMMAVAYTNILHLVVLYVGMLAVLAVCVVRMGGIGEISRELPASYFSMTSIGMPKVSSWLIASVLGACTAQAGLQPVLAAKDEKTASRASYLIALIIAPFGIITALLGMYAKIQFPDLASGKQALASVIFTVPNAMGGIVIAAVLAAILSTVSPILLACGTLFTKDIIHTENLKQQRLVTVLAGIVCILAALVVGDRAVILEMVYFAYGIRGSLFVVLFLAIYWKRTSPKAAISAMLLTAAVSIVWVLYKNIVGQYPIAWFTETYVAVLTALLVTVLGSLMDKRGSVQ